VGASTETVRNNSPVRKVRLEDVCRVGFDAVDKFTSFSVFVLRCICQLEEYDDDDDDDDDDDEY